MASQHLRTSFATMTFLVLTDLAGKMQGLLAHEKGLKSCGIQFEIPHDQTSGGRWTPCPAPLPKMSRNQWDADHRCDQCDMWQPNSMHRALGAFECVRPQYNFQGRCHSSLHCFECDTLSLLPHCMQTLMILAEVSATAGSKLASPQAKQSLGRCTKAILLQTTPARPWIASNFVQTIAKTVPSLVGIGLSLLLICPLHVLFGASLACCNLALSAVLFWLFFCQGSLERLSRRCPKRPHPKQLRRQNWNDQCERWMTCSTWRFWDLYICLCLVLTMMYKPIKFMNLWNPENSFGNSDLCVPCITKNCHTT